MLITCPECELQVSDRAITCPHCGYPMINKPSIKRNNTTKHRRLPNGFGRISKINNKKLRNPYRAMVTVGFTDEGKPIGKLLKPKSYFATYNEAYEALVEYNKDPYDLNESITVQDLYDKWSTVYFKKLKSDSSIRTITAAWNKCSDLYNMRAVDVRARHIKAVMENIQSPNLKSRVKSLFNLMYDYAVEYELCDRNYAREFNYAREDNEAAKEHISFKNEEMSILWNDSDNYWTAAILIQCYTGFRPQELCMLETKNLDLVNWTISGGMKTKAGINRIVPLHTRIRPLIRRLYRKSTEIGSEYFIIDDDNSKMTYDKYKNRFRATIKRLNLNPEHRPHDPRKQFITMCKKYNVDEYAIKKMAGHQINDITEKIYTDRDSNWLNNEIEKIKEPM